MGGVDWQTVLVASIAPVLIAAGLVFNQIFRNRNARVDTDNATTLKREPTWVELEESNRKLRAEMQERDEANDQKMAEQKEAFDAQIAELRGEFGDFKRKTNVKIAAMSNMLHTASVQWPEDAPGPYFDPADLDALEHTDVPYIWRNRARPRG